VVGNDLSKLILDVLGVGGLATNATQGYRGEVELALLDPVAGRLGKQEETNGEDDSPKELDGDRDAVGTSVAAVLGSVNNAVGEQDTNGDAELVTYGVSTKCAVASKIKTYRQR
jgi:hypothetical protein